MVDLIIHLSKNKKIINALKLFLLRSQKIEDKILSGSKATQLNFITTVKDEFTDTYDVIYYLVNKYSITEVMNSTKKALKIQDFCNTNKAIVFSAQTLSDSHKNNIKHDIVHNVFQDINSTFFTKEKTTVVFKIDENLISGLLIQIGEYIFDNSMMSKIRNAI